MSAAAPSAADARGGGGRGGGAVHGARGSGKQQQVRRDREPMEVRTYAEGAGIYQEGEAVAWARSRSG